MEEKKKEVKKPKSVPCKLCEDWEEYCLSCRDKMKQVINMFWWD
jgi:hypothetical protein